MQHFDGPWYHTLNTLTTLMTSGYGRWPREKNEGWHAIVPMPLGESAFSILRKMRKRSYINIMIKLKLLLANICYALLQGYMGTLTHDIKGLKLIWVLIFSVSNSTMGWFDKGMEDTHVEENQMHRNNWSRNKNDHRNRIAWLMGN